MLIYLQLSVFFPDFPCYCHGNTNLMIEIDIMILLFTWVQTSFVINNTKTFKMAAHCFDPNDKTRYV